MIPNGLFNISVQNKYTDFSVNRKNYQTVAYLKISVFQDY